jgi:hypothetical protein
MLLVDLRAFQRYWTDDLMTQADIMARVTAPALAFNDNETARQNLAVLRVRPQILAAAIYTSNGTRFAGYVAPGAAGNALLVVTECDGGLQQGSAINFRIVDERVRFDVALDAAERNGIKLSSRLLTVANRVQKGAQ